VDHTTLAIYHPAAMIVYTRCPTVLAEQFADTLILLDHRDGQCVQLNAAAGCVWHALSQPAAVATVADALVAQFGIGDARARGDAQSALEDLVARGFVTRGTPAPE
jgi:hypothetical protein